MLIWTELFCRHPVDSSLPCTCSRSSLMKRNLSSYFCFESELRVVKIVESEPGIVEFKCKRCKTRASCRRAHGAAYFPPCSVQKGDGLAVPPFCIPPHPPPPPTPPLPRTLPSLRDEVLVSSFQRRVDLSPLSHSRRTNTAALGLPRHPSRLTMHLSRPRPSLHARFN